METTPQRGREWMMNDPSTAGGDGRNEAGRFVPGNKIGQGNPHCSRVARLRSALLESISTQDVEDIIQALVGLAKKGDVQASREVLQRTLGPAQAMDVLQRLAEIEERLDAVAEGRVR